MALELGYPHPDHLLRELTSKQLSEWMAYFMLEPFGPRREDERFGILACQVIGPHLKKGKKVSINNFFPDRVELMGRKRRKQSWQEQMKILMPLVNKDK